MERGSFSEYRRQVLHMAVGGCALLLRYLDWWEAGALAACALAFNLYALPRIAGPHVYRDGEHTRRFTSGIALYPLAVLLLILTLRDRMDIVAAAWGILAVGDGMATIAGRAIGGPRIPWNREKSIAGSAALWLCGGAAGAALCWWCSPTVIPPSYPWFIVAGPMAAALAAAAVESIPIRLDDNITVPAASAAVLWWLSLVSEDAVAAWVAAAAPRLPLAIAMNGAVAAAGYFGRTVSVSGALAGAAIGTVVAITAGWPGWVLLFATFFAATASSRLGLRRKTLLGIAEPRGGRRGAGNAIANTGAAAAAAALASVSYATEPAMIAFVAALAAGGSDTIASEIGKAWGRRTFLFPAFRRVPPGTSGAVSLEGTAAGLLGAMMLGSAGVWLALVPANALVAVVAGATAGSFAESAMGATLEDAGFVNNDVLNFLNTVIAAAFAVYVAKALG